jgi:hypothetical protein
MGYGYLLFGGDTQVQVLKFHSLFLRFQTIVWSKCVYVFEPCKFLFVFVLSSSKLQVS